MKKLMFIFVLTPLLAMVSPQDSNLQQITKAISEGDATALGAFFDNSVEIAVFDEEDVYSKAEAIRVVEDFFSRNRPKSFSLVHQGTSKGNDSQYCICNLVAGTGTFRVYVYMKTNRGKLLIQELRFDEE